jgi:hypothetical protein
VPPRVRSSVCSKSGQNQVVRVRVGRERVESSRNSLGFQMAVAQRGVADHLMGGADLLQPVCPRALITANPDRNSATWGCSRGWRKRDVGYWTFPAGRSASTMARRVPGCLCGATDQWWGGQTLYPLPPRARCGRSFPLASIRLLRPKRAPSSSWRRARPGHGRRRLLG